MDTVPEIAQCHPNYSTNKTDNKVFTLYRRDINDNKHGSIIVVTSLYPGLNPALVLREGAIPSGRELAMPKWTKQQEGVGPLSQILHVK